MRTAIGSVMTIVVAISSGCGAPSTPVIDQPAPTQGAAKPSTPNAEQETVRKILAEQFHVDAAAIKMDQSITEPPLSADDLDLVEIVMELEERFEISIPDASVPELSEKNQLTPNQLVSIVREAQKENGVRPQ